MSLHTDYNEIVSRKMTNKCVKELVGFINVFQIYPMFRQMVAIFRGSWNSTTTDHTGRIVIRIRLQHRYYLSSF
jgi:hypothetical protein